MGKGGNAQVTIQWWERTVGSKPKVWLQKIPSHILDYSKWTVIKNNGISWVINAKNTSYSATFKVVQMNRIKYQLKLETISQNFFMPLYLEGNNEKAIHFHDLSHDPVNTWSTLDVIQNYTQAWFSSFKASHANRNIYSCTQKW